MDEEGLVGEQPLRHPPSSCIGWIGPVITNLTVAEAMRLERSSRAWHEWFVRNDDIWHALALTAGVYVEAMGPLAKYFRVASWRHVCVDCAGEVWRDLRATDDRLLGRNRRVDDGEAVRLGDVVAVPDGNYGEVESVLFSGRFTVRGRVGALWEASTKGRVFDGAELRVLGPRSAEWWRARAALEVDDDAARNFVVGVASCAWIAEAGGVYTFVAARATPIHYRFLDTDDGANRWTWSPDRLNWMACSDVVPQGSRWRAHSLVDANREIARFLDRHGPEPAAWAREPSRIQLRAAPHARAQHRALADDDLETQRNACRAIAPRAHGGILGLSNTHVHVVHHPCDNPTLLLHLEPWTISGHTGGWAHSETQGATWSLGLGRAAASITSVGSSEAIINNALDDDDDPDD